MHGIGKYIGLKTIETEGIHRDYIEIAYAGTDKLFLPANNLDQLQNTLAMKVMCRASIKWVVVIGLRLLQRPKNPSMIWQISSLKIYAQREITEGFCILPDQPWQQEFEDAFPYEETEDQLQATAEIKASMEKPVPMDRLLAGDVGFGKTRSGYACHL